MPRPNTKEELLLQSQTNYKKLLDYLVNMADLSKELPKGYLNRNARDILSHLHHWHLMFMDWYEVGMNAGKPDMPAKGYTWRTLPDLNREIWKMYQDKTYEETLDLLKRSHSKIQTIIKRHSDEELFTKKKYKWTGSTSLAVYIISNSVSHYNWALKLLKKI